MSQYNEVLSRIPVDLLRRLDAGEIIMTCIVMPDSYEYNYYMAHVNIGVLLETLGQNEEAIRHYTIALKVIPFAENVQAKMKRAIINRNHGMPPSEPVREKEFGMGADK